MFNKQQVRSNTNRYKTNAANNEFSDFFANEPQMITPNQVIQSNVQSSVPGVALS
jgi:hypothetical protein